VLPIATTELETRAYRARAWQGGWAIGSDGSEVTVADKALQVISRLDVGLKPEDIAITPDGSLIVVASWQGLSARDIRTSCSTWSIRGKFVASRAASNWIWAAESFDDEIELTLRDRETGEAVRRATIEDPFGKSAVMLFAHPNERSMVVWVAAGQNGQASYLASDDGTDLRVAEIAPRDRLPPLFLPGGETYVIGGDDILEHRRWPSGERIGPG